MMVDLHTNMENRFFLQGIASINKNYLQFLQFHDYRNEISIEKNYEGKDHEKRKCLNYVRNASVNFVHGLENDFCLCFILNKCVDFAFKLCDDSSLGIIDNQ